MCEYPEYDVNEIIPGLWLGNLKSAYSKSFLDKYKITNILTLYEEFDYTKKYSNINYMIIPIRDRDLDSIKLNELFDITGQFIYQALKKKENILVHCKKGHHRSGATVAAFLIKYCKFEYEKAIKYINSLRPCALRRDKYMSKELFSYVHPHCKNYNCNSNNGYYKCLCNL